MEFQIRKAELEECFQIKDLQDEAHFKNIADAEKKTDGYVSLETSISLLKKLCHEIGIIVAVSGTKVIGYEMPVDLRNTFENPLLQNFIKDVLNLEYESKKISEYKIIIEGQICIKKEYRGRCIAEKLHKNFVELVKPKYELIVTGVSKNNPRSLHVHLKKLGFSILRHSSNEGSEWVALVQDLRNM